MSGGAQPKNSLQISDDLEFAEENDDDCVRESVKKWVRFEDYKELDTAKEIIVKERNEADQKFKSVVDRLGLFYREVLSIDLDPAYVLPSELTERAVARIRTEFYRRFSEFFVVEKCVGGQEKK